MSAPLLFHRRAGSYRIDIKGTLPAVNSERTAAIIVNEIAMFTTVQNDFGIGRMGV